MAPTIRHAAGALQLRRFALRILAGGGDDARQAWQQASAIPEPAWRLFLAVEHCAGPLARVLRDMGLAPATGSALAAALLDETQRTLSARSVMNVIGDAAGETAARAVLLKGATAVDRGHTIYLLDVDVLTEQATGVALAEAVARGTGADRTGTASVRHLPTIGSLAALPVEVHTTIANEWTGLGPAIWNRVVPAGASSHLQCLAPVDHAVHILTHMVIDHPERRGRLRDTALLGIALEDLEEAERAAIDLLVGATPYAAVLQAQLRFADGLRRRTSREDPFEAAAFTRYWMTERMAGSALRRSTVVATLIPTTRESIAAILSGWSLGPTWRDGLHEPTAKTSSLGFTRVAERISPRAGRAVRVGLRAAHYVIAYAAALAVTPVVRAAGRRAGLTL